MNQNRERMIRFAYLLIVVMAIAAPIGAEAMGQININTANVDELALLPRVGPSVAGRIVEFREQNGSFGSIEELMLVRGIGEKTFELIEPYVKLKGDSDLEEKVSVPRKSASAAGSNDGR